MGGSDGVVLTSYPALLWLATLSALLGSFQNGGRRVLAHSRWLIIGMMPQRGRHV
jgi:hypothetical protein